MLPNFWNDTSMSWAFSPWRCGDEMERSENDMMLGDQNEVLYKQLNLHIKYTCIYKYIYRYDISTLDIFPLRMHIMLYG